MCMFTNKERANMHIFINALVNKWTRVGCRVSGCRDGQLFLSFWLLFGYHVLCKLTHRLRENSLHQGNIHVSSGIWHHGHGYVRTYVCVFLEEPVASILRLFQALVSQDHKNLNMHKPERSVMSQSSPVQAFTSSFCKNVLISSSHVSWCFVHFIMFRF